VEYDLALPGVVFALHWAFVTLFAAIGARFALSLSVVAAVGYRLPELHGWRAVVIEPLRNWDGFWYSLIAEYGYRFHSATTAFWPLYPWTMQFVAESVGIEVETAGLILANLAFFGALVVFYRLALVEWGEGVARRAVWLIAFFPTTFYFSAVYSESFFLLFSVLAFYWARTGKWWQAGLAGALVALTRNLGMLIVVPMAIMFLRQHGMQPRRWFPNAFALALPPAGAALFFAYLWNVYGDPFVTLDAQSGWARERAMPWTTFSMTLDQLGLTWLRLLWNEPGWSTLTSLPVRFSFSEYESLDLTFTLLALPLLLYCLRRLPLEYSVFPLLLFLPPLFNPSTIHPLMSIPRFLLVMFPLFIGLAQLTRRRWLFIGWMSFSVILLAALTIQFTTWFWVA
jgi:hypothetical protein